VRKLIKHILNESFLTEKAAPRKKFVQPKPEKKYPSTGKWIHSSWVGDDGKFHIIWQDDVDKIDELNQEIVETERIIDNIRASLLKLRYDRRVVPGYVAMLYSNKSKYEARLEQLKMELESLNIDNPLTNYFDI